MTNEEKNKRIEKTKNKLREKSKYGLSLIKEVKNKFQEGLKVKEVNKASPKDGFELYEKLLKVISLTVNPFVTIELAGKLD